MLLKKELSVIENSYYEASVVRPVPALSLADRITIDVCVIGGGYAGLSAAIELRNRGYSVALLEAQRIGWGASGRNGGEVIVGFGSDGEAAIEKQSSPEDAQRAWNISLDALDLLQSRMTQYNIDCEYTPGYMNVAVNARKAKMLNLWYEHVIKKYNYSLQWIDPANISHWIDSKRFYAGVYDPRSGHIHPLKYCLGLAQAAHDLGVNIYENSAVYQIERGANPVVKTAQGEVTCKYVVLAGNVYISEYGHIAPELAERIVPVGTYIIATDPMEKKRADALIRHRAAVSDNNFILDYFRVSADNRLLFGAGESYTATTPRDLIMRMRKRMLNVFPQLYDLDIPYSWGGFVDLTMNKAPHFGRLGKNIYYLQGFSGHGVALTGIAGKLVADALAGDAEKFDVFSRLKHQKFPGGELTRTPLLLLGMWYYRLKDLL